MADFEETIQSLRKLTIDIKDLLAHARYRLDALDLILEGVSDRRAADAGNEVFDLAEKKLEEVDDGLDELYRQLSGLSYVLNDKS